MAERFNLLRRCVEKTGNGIANGLPAAAATERNSSNDVSIALEGDTSGSAEAASECSDANPTCVQQYSLLALAISILSPCIQPPIRPILSVFSTTTLSKYSIDERCCE